MLIQIARPQELDTSGPSETDSTDPDVATETTDGKNIINNY